MTAPAAWSPSPCATRDALHRLSSRQAYLRLLFGLTERYSDPPADNGAGTGAVASLLGVEDGKAETPLEPTRAEAGSGLTLDEDKPFRPRSEILAALTDRYSNVAIGKILDVSEAAVRMMVRRAGIRRANRVSSSLDDWRAAIIRAELKAELARKDKANGTVITG